VGRLDAYVGQTPTLLIRGSDLHRRHDFAPLLNLARGHHTWLATIAAVCIFSPPIPSQQTIERGPRHRIKIGSRIHQQKPLRVASRQRAKPTTQGRDSLHGYCHGPHHHAPATAISREPADESNSSPWSRAVPGAFGEPSPLT